MPLLSVATSLACAHPMHGVSWIFGLLTDGACAVAAATLMFFRSGALLWVEAQSGVDLSWWFSFPAPAVAVGVAGSLATVGICQLRWATVPHRDESRQ